MTGVEVVCPQCGYSTLRFGDSRNGCPCCDEITDDAPDGIVKHLDGSPALVERGSALARRAGL